MIKEVMITADSVEEAKAQAVQQLATENVEIEVIKQPEKKKFGIFGGSPAVVRAYTVLPPLESAKEYLKNILELMGIGNVVVTSDEADGGAVLNIEGDEIGFVIGHRGETLDAIQYLTGLVANHVEDEYYRISINIGNYREKREKTLEILGRKLAFKACKSGVKTSLEPMNPYERRIIHTAVQRVRGAISWSEGEDLRRHVVIGPDPDYKPNYRGGYKGRNNSFNRDGSYNRKPHSTGYQRRQYSDGEAHPQDSMFSTFENDTDLEKVRESINERPDTSLYGRIDVKKSSDESVGDI